MCAPCGLALPDDAARGDDAFVAPRTLSGARNIGQDLEDRVLARLKQLKLVSRKTDDVIFTLPASWGCA